MKYFFIAGEKSGDQHAANLIAAIHREDSKCDAVGWGGDQMEQADMRLLRNYQTFTTFGIWEVLSRLKLYNDLLNVCLSDVIQENPDCLILVDFGGFNLRMAALAKKAGYKVFYYIPPKLWAWGKWRIHLIKRNVDRVYCVFPFEVEVFQDLGYDKIEYVGNPTFNSLAKVKNKRNDHSNSIVFLPGSRRGEVLRAIPVINDLAKFMPEREFYVSIVSNLDRHIYDSLEKLPNVHLESLAISDLVSKGSYAVVTSGTASLEMAFLNMPQVVVYRTSRITYLIARLLVRVKFISLVNILLGRGLIIELIQKRYSAKCIINGLKMLEQTDNQKKISEGYSEICEMLGEADPAENTARSIFNLCRS